MINIKILLLIITSYFSSLALFAEEPLILEATVSRSNVLQAEPFSLQITLTNHSSSTIVLPTGLSVVGCSGLQVEVSNGSKKISYIGLVADCIPHEQFLKANEKMYLTVPMTFCFAIATTGRYEICVSYDTAKYTRQEDNTERSWHGRVEANPAEFIVREPQGIDKEAYDFMFKKRKAMWEKSASEKKTRIPSDDEIRGRIGADFWLEDTQDLIEKFPSSIYTAYALYTKYGLMKERVGFDPRAKELARNLELIPRHHPDFVFIDEVYEMLGEFYNKEGDIAKARLYYEKLAKTTKDPERKTRAEEFLKALEEK